MFLNSPDLTSYPAYTPYTPLLFTRLVFHDVVVKRIYQVDKIASGISYKTLKLWEIYDHIFRKVSKIHRIHENNINTINERGRYINIVNIFS